MKTKWNKYMKMLKDRVRKDESFTLTDVNAMVRDACTEAFDKMYPDDQDILTQQISSIKGKKCPKLSHNGGLILFTAISELLNAEGD